MNPLIWLGVGILGMLFSSKKAQAATILPDNPATPPTPAPPTIKAGLNEPVISTPIPAGWRRLASREVTPDVLAFANSALGAIGSRPYGTTMASSDGRVMAMVEQHFHEPGGPVKPWGLHHGITLLGRV